MEKIPWIFFFSSYDSSSVIYLFPHHISTKSPIKATFITISRWNPFTRRWQNDSAYNPFIVVICRLHKASGEEIEICKAAKVRWEQIKGEKGKDSGRAVMVSPAECVDELLSFCAQGECIALFNSSFASCKQTFEGVQDIWREFSSWSTGKHTVALRMNDPEMICQRVGTFIQLLIQHVVRFHLLAMSVALIP